MGKDSSLPIVFCAIILKLWVEVSNQILFEHQFSSCYNNKKEGGFMSKKAKIVFVCQECGYDSPKY